MSEPYPIVIAAFGTTSRARSVYAKADQYLRSRFPGHPLFWGYSSRTVSHKLRQQDINLPTPVEVLDSLATKGHRWAVIQSFNMICGHEFQRLHDSVRHGRVRVSIGHSLLCSTADFHIVAQSLAPLFGKDLAEAVVLVGHGTDHCSWSVYPAFEKILRSFYGHRAFVGVIEGDYPDRETVIEEICASGFTQVRLVPLMLMAGVHFSEDLAGTEDSWKTALRAKNIVAVLENEGLAGNPAILDIFADHIRRALDVIPDITDSEGDGDKGSSAGNLGNLREPPRRFLSDQDTV